MLRLRIAIVILPALLAGCQPPGQPALDPSVAAGTPAVITPAPTASSERFIAIGTEPFWNVTIRDGNATYSTPESPDGQTFAVVVAQDGASRRFSGSLPGQPFVLSIRPEACSDGMSDRQYGHAADLSFGGEALKGCAEPGTEFKGE